MRSFPQFLKNTQNRIAPSQQNTEAIEGYFFQGADDTQIAFWECHADRVSKQHAHDFDEYMICVSGEYTAYLDGKEIILKPGDELVIPKGTVQWGRCTAGTRTIHAFGGRRITCGAIYD
jgi:quercetin dioxygenase-like cupin family protein